MKNLDKAREWARDNINDFYEDESAYAVCEVIESLPDQWFDADKVWKALNGCRGMKDPHQVMAHIEKELLAPSLPTLADLIEQEENPADYIFGWVKTEDGIELLIMENDECVYTLDSRGYRFGRDFHEVTPLPDLPRLEWPGSHADTITEEPEGFQNEKS